MKKMKLNNARLLSMVFLAIFLPGSLLLGKPSNTSKKEIRSEYKVGKVSCKNPSVKQYKKYSGYNKYLNRPKKNN